MVITEDDSDGTLCRKPDREPRSPLPVAHGEGVPVAGGGQLVPPAGTVSAPAVPVHAAAATAAPASTPNAIRA